MAKTPIKPTPGSRAARAALKPAEAKPAGLTREEFERLQARRREAREQALRKKKSGRPASLINADTGEPIDDVTIAWFIERFKPATGGNARKAAQMLRDMWKIPPEGPSVNSLRVRGSKYRNEVTKPPKAPKPTKKKTPRT